MVLKSPSPWGLVATPSEGWELSDSLAAYQVQKGHKVSWEQAARQIFFWVLKLTSYRTCFEKKGHSEQQTLDTRLGLHTIHVCYIIIISDRALVMSWMLFTMFLLLIGSSRPGHCPGKILVNCVLTTIIIVLWDDGAEPSHSKDNQPV